MAEKFAFEAKPPRGRTKGFVMSGDHRVKIQNANILNRLIECAEGKLELTKTQASVGLGLLKKVFPDLQSVELGNPEGEEFKVKATIERIIIDPANPDSAGVSTASATKPL
jgi:hypothetical protein